MTESNAIMNVGEGLSYDLKGILGRGSYGSMVFVGEFGENKQKIAVKRFQLNHIKSNSIATFEATFVSTELKDSNILQYLAIGKDSNFLFIVTELCAGTLQHLVAGKYQGPPIGDIDEKGILLQITSGLNYLHSSNIVHRDIKPSNILISFPSSEAAEMSGNNGKALFKLADFGIVSTLITDERDFRKKKEYVDPHGTRGWIPPELYDSDTDYDSKVDIFALGCVFGYTLSGGKHLFGDNPLEQAIQILRKKPMTLALADLKKPFCNDGKLFELIESMVKMEPTIRPTSYAVLNNPFFLKCDTGTEKEKMKIVVGELSYDPNDIIGKGAFGIVFSGYYSQIPVAVKRIQRGDVNIESAAKQGVELMIKAKGHPNILRYISKETNKDFVFIATELCSGTLQEYVEGRYNGPQFRSEREILFQVTQGLARLHELGIVHRNIKPTNILIYVPPSFKGTVESKPQIKLAGFCCSKITDEVFTYNSTSNPTGTRGWIAPELYRDQKTGPKADIFALGLIFGYTLSGGKHPFGDDPDEWAMQIKKEGPMQMVRNDLKKPYSNNDEAFDLIKSMLAISPKKRPIVTNILNNFFSSDLILQDAQKYECQKLLENICSSSLKTSFFSSFEDDSITDTSIATFRNLIRDGLIDANIQLQSGKSPLHYLCCYYRRNNLINFIQLLIDKGADVNALDTHSWTPLHSLCYYYKNDNLIDIAQLLIKNGTDVNAIDEDGDTPLHNLCRAYHNDNLIDVIQLLIENNAEVNVKNKDGWTPLHFLCYNYLNDNLIGIVQLLIKKGAEVDTKTKHGSTPLLILCQRYDNSNLMDMIKVFQQNGAEMNAKDNDGDTSLLLVCGNYTNDNLMEIVQFLIQEGARANAKNEKGETPLHLLCHCYEIDNVIKIAKFLIQKGARANEKNKKGETPLHVLCHCYEIKAQFKNINRIKEKDNLKGLISLFEKHGASMNAKDNEGTTPIHYLFRRKINKRKPKLWEPFSTMERMNEATSQYSTFQMPYEAPTAQISWPVDRSIGPQYHRITHY